MATGKDRITRNMGVFTACLWVCGLCVFRFCGDARSEVSGHEISVGSFDGRAVKLIGQTKIPTACYEDELVLFFVEGSDGTRYMIASRVYNRQPSIAIVVQPNVADGATK